jgi:hypothetical protein
MPSDEKPSFKVAVEADVGAQTTACQRHLKYGPD